MKKNLTKQDEVVLEMTTNTWQLYDENCGVCRFSDGCPSAARDIDHQIASHERQDRRLNLSRDY